MQSVAADIALIHVAKAKSSILVIKRNTEPFKGSYALPGGFLDETDQSTEETALRELEEEVGISKEDANLLAFGALGFYSDKDRDPRSRVVSAAYYAFVSEKPELTINPEEVQSAEWICIAGMDEFTFAFDHELIVRDAYMQLVKYLQDKVSVRKYPLRRV
jgi:8-oxo-dGTP diphosphatase